MAASGLRRTTVDHHDPIDLVGERLTGRERTAVREEIRLGNIVGGTLRRLEQSLELRLSDWLAPWPSP